jgi:class 3 adenylate cyclase
MQAAETRFAVLLFTDIVGATGLKERYGVPAFSAALVTHNRHFERLARECHLTILQNLGDGYFAEAGGVAEAVRFALLFQDAMREGPWGEVSLTTRIGIHAGEISAIIAAGGSGIVAPAADLASRVMSVALGGQILLTRSLFDEARLFIREHPQLDGRTAPPLSWLAHGPYRFKGREDPLEIFEVGAEGLAPLTAPPDAEKAKRAIRPGEEETLGWRPAKGREIPNRPGWHLTELLGAGGFGEVWTGEHAKLRQRRAFKFCFDDERLRALKREVTLVRLLGSALGERDDIVKIHELKLDEPPFYLESDLAPHGNLLQWAEKQGGLEQIPLATRIALVAHTATALAAAHSIGVLHKDIKPTNILIFDGLDGEPRPRLVDFGIGALADPAVLGQHGVTAAGFTRATIEHSTGTPTYSPPEYLAGRPYTIQGDIYGLGVLLYQLVTAKANDPLAPGWERDVEDPLLREDIAACVDGNPARRLPSAAELAERLETLGQRRAEIAEKERLTRAEAARIEAEAATVAARQRTARFRKLAAAFAALAVLAISGGVLTLMKQREATTQRDLATFERNRAMAQETKANQQVREAAQKAWGAARQAMDRDEPGIGLARLAEAQRYNAALPEKLRLPGIGWDAGSLLLQLPTLAPLPVSEPMRHDRRVNSASFSPDGTRVVTASDDKTAQVWDAASGKPLGEPMRHQESVNTASFSPDGTRVVTASWDNTARVWDAASGKPLGELMRHENWVNSASFSPDGTRVVMASDDKTARLWEAGSGKLVGEPMRHEGLVRSASFSPDGTRVVTASYDEMARLWDAASGKLVGEPIRHEGWVNSANFSPDGTRVVTASGDKTARVWELWQAGDEPPTPELLEAFAGMRVNTEGRIVSIATDDRADIVRRSLNQSADSSPRRRLLRWLSSDPRTRTLSPNSRITVTEHVEREITWVMDHPKDENGPAILRGAYEMDPAHPLIHIALAAVDENEVTREFLKDYGLKRLAAAEAISDKAAYQKFPGTYRAKAAIILSLQGDKPRASQVFADLLAKHDPLRQTWGSSAWIEKLDDFEWPKVFREALLELAK